MATRRATRRQNRTLRGRDRAAGLLAEPLEDRRMLALGVTATDEAAYGSVDPAWFTSLQGLPPAIPALSPATGGAGIAAIGGAGLMRPVQTAGGKAVQTGGEWVVRLAPATLSQVRSVAEAAAFLGTAGVEVVRGLGLPGQILVRAAGAAAGSDVAAGLRRIAGVSYVAANSVLALSVTPDDPLYGHLFGLDNVGQTGGAADADIDAPAAWEIETGSRSTVVGIVDTGIDWTHPDLAPNVWTNPGEIAGNGIDDDRNGFIDDVHGYDFVNRDGDPMDDHGHGTHVSGTIGAAGNNGVGVVGVNWDVSLMGLKFLDASGSGSNADAIEAINYATMMRSMYGVNIRVLNNSWGGGGFDPGLLDAINASGAAGILFVAAAGNSAADNDATPAYPAGYESPSIVSVAATDHRDALASFSSYGGRTVDLAAPGVNILSTVPGGYGSLSGTSMATPHVAGVAALAASVDPGLDVAGLKDLLLGSVDPLPSLAGKTARGGRLNAEKVVRAARQGVAAPSITGRVYEDLAGDAWFDAVDPAVRGVTVFIDTDGDGRLTVGEPAVPTTGGGRYAFSGLAAGSYTVRTVAAAGWAAAGSLTVTVADGITATGNDIGLFRAGAVYGRVVEDIDGNGTVDPGEPPIVNQQVFDDVNGNGVRDTAVSVVESGLVSLPIGDFATTTSAIVVGGLAESIVDLNVTLTISHTWVGDLFVALVAPDGTTIPLSNHRGGSGRNFTNAVFDDEAVTAISRGTAPFTGRFRPDGSLSIVDGRSPDGTWVLQVSDAFAGDVGTLVSWSLGFTTTAERTATSDANGFFALAPSGAGEHVIRLVSSAAFSPSGPSGGGRAVMLADGATVFGTDLTAARRNSIAGRVFSDVDADGVRDAGEAGLAAVTVYVDSNGNGLLDAAEVRTQTDARGVYRFTGRAAGTQSIRVVVPATLGLVAPTSGKRSATLVAGGTSINNDFALTPNRAPTGVTLSAARLAENAAPGTIVGTLAGVDPDIGDRQSLSLVAGAGADDNASFTLVAGQLRAAVPFDFEARGSASIRVRTTDSLGQSFEQPFVITITNVNESPTGVVLSRDLIRENAGVNAFVGMLAGLDPDAGDTFSYRLVAGAGAADNALFNISGAALRASGSFDFETRSGYSVRIRATDRGGRFTEAAFTIGVTDVNDAPVLGGIAGSVSYLENGVVVAAPGATVSDVDSPDFASGTLTVRVSANASSTDRIEIRGAGGGDGQVDVGAGVVSYGGVAVGSVVGGGSGTVPLVVTFNGLATATVVAAVLRSVQYRSTSDNPQPLTRRLTYAVSDGDGGGSATVTQVVAITPVNDAPVLGRIAATVTYRENAGLLVAGAATIADIDSANLDTGVLTVSLGASGGPDDRLVIRHQGTASGLVGVSGADVTFGGVVVGTIAGGTFAEGSVTPLAVTFNAAASPVIAQAVLRNVVYVHASDAPVGPLDRSLTFSLTDGDGGTASIVTQTLTIVPVNDAPLVGGIAAGIGYAAGGSPLLLAAGATVSDVDSATFAGGILTVAINAGGRTSDQLTVQSQGTEAGQIGVAGNAVSHGGTTIGTRSGGTGTTPLTIVLNAAATAEAVGALLRSIAYANLAVDPTSGGAAPTRSVRFTLSDAASAAGGLTVTRFQTISLTR